MKTRPFLIFVIVTAIVSAASHLALRGDCDLSYAQAPLLASTRGLAIEPLPQPGRGVSYIDGDSPYYAMTCESLLRDGDLDITNNITSSADLSISREELRPHEGFFAVSPGGRVVPKHSTLLPILSVPFRWLFGIHGYLVINVIVAILLVISVAKLAGDTNAARLLAFGLFITSSWFGYTFNYSPDLFVALLITAAFAFARYERWLLCGVMAGLAVWAKAYAAVILLPLAIIIVPAGVRATLLAVCGSSFGIIPMLWINMVLYGGPLVTGYDCDGRINAAGNGFITREHYSLFNQPMVQGTINVLFDLRAGMIRTAPAWFLWPFGLLMILQQPTGFPKRFAISLALASLFNVLLFAHYECWDATTNGNRFLFPAVALGGALLEPLVALLLDRISKRR
ncbi:hypothetical protein BH11PLA2_BH11PLA2_18780 [soil metagenome]